MYKHLARLREIHGPKHFKWLPLTFILPNEMGSLQEAMVSNPQLKVKVSSSQEMCIKSHQNSKWLYLSTWTILC
jgi:hypothetical protein